MGEEQLTFSHTVESVLRALGPSLTPELKNRMREKGIDPDKALLPAYPRTTWEAVIGVIAQTVHPTLARDEAHRMIGRKLSKNYNETAIGRAIKNVLRLRGPERTLRRMTQTFRSGNNYADTKLTQLSENSFELWVNETNGSPGYIQGVLETVMENSGAPGVKVAVKSFDGHGATYLIAW